jgi:hypothetical protein
MRSKRNGVTRNEEYGGAPMRVWWKAGGGTRGGAMVGLMCAEYTGAKMISEHITEIIKDITFHVSGMGMCEP